MPPTRIVCGEVPVFVIFSARCLKAGTVNTVAFVTYVNAVFWPLPILVASGPPGWKLLLSLSAYPTSTLKPSGADTNVACPVQPFPAEKMRFSAGAGSPVTHITEPPAKIETVPPCPDKSPFTNAGFSRYHTLRLYLSEVFIRGYSSPSPSVR